MNTGAAEWADIRKNICLGCDHDCGYCYSRADALRFNRIKNASEWPKMVLNQNALDAPPRRLPSRIMFPSTHDITPKILDVTIEWLRKWLDVGNEFLIVSKPHLECIKRICSDLKAYRKQVLFRFTIGSTDDGVLRFWEPNAPDFEERINCLKHAYELNWATSVSCEPYLDWTITALVGEVLPYVTETVWIGKMNQIKRRVDTSMWTSTDLNHLRVINNVQSDRAVQGLYNYFKDEPKIRWKDSIKSILGLPPEGASSAWEAVKDGR